MNGKRVKEKSCARACSIIAIKCNISELSERSQGIRVDTRSPNVHKHIPDYPPRSFVFLQFPPSLTTYLMCSKTRSKACLKTSRAKCLLFERSSVSGTICPQGAPADVCKLASIKVPRCVCYSFVVVVTTVAFAVAEYSQECIFLRMSRAKRLLQR